MANETMKKTVFREKSIERVSSPEQLNEYIRVANPSVWVILIAIVILLAGVCVWGVMGHLDTVLPAAAIAEGGELTVYVKEENIQSVEAGMKVVVDGREYVLQQISGQPVAVGPDFSEYALHVGELRQGEWVFPVCVEAALADGVYRAEIVIESVSPMSFVLN